ncbi:hypothetical protein QC761_608045 [Podospora bellae-mahoneyi]|uniref:Tautomerase cis-CaaD-like domain-containing protein n=1 Tax=Podospora bellae-mahoneyi TaxID=2093777 RepID=A0ABR0FCW3_9PEZI|nr:hypothetical protein QC761_608045 [Podospora bellae-mahoneyi]
MCTYTPLSAVMAKNVSPSCTITISSSQPSTSQIGFFLSYTHLISPKLQNITLTSATMGLLRKLLGRKPKTPRAQTTTFTSPNPFPDEETFAAVKAHVMARARANASNPEYIAMQRHVAFSAPTTFLEANYPPEKNNLITPMGPIPTDTGEGIRVDDETVIPCEDTMFFMVLKHDPEGKKMPEMKMLFFVAIPPKGCGGEFAGTPMAYETLGTEGWKAVEREAEGFVRKWNGAGEMGRRPEEGVKVVVQMGMDMGVWEWRREGGLVEPEGGVEMREVRDEGRWERDGMRLPPTTGEVEEGVAR